jgi:YD repeat-containing protein
MPIESSTNEITPLKNCDLDISKTGNSKLALREGHDVKNSAFSGIAGQFNNLTIANSEYAGTTSDPVLEVTYSVPSTPVATKLQDLSYSYDSVGNITNIVDASQNNAAKTAAYSYDDLYRLTTATITGAANGQNYTQTYTYSPTGNITNRSDVGAYSYGGIHPQAVSSAGGISNVYDNNGSLTSAGTWTHVYDLKNRLISSNSGATSLTYTYDESGNRIKKVNPAAAKTTLYISKFYDLEGSDQKKSIYIGDLKVATDSSTTGLTYHNADHLTGANIDTDTAGKQISLLDYYPYGNTRLEEKTGAYTNDTTIHSNWSWNSL